MYALYISADIKRLEGEFDNTHPSSGNVMNAYISIFNTLHVFIQKPFIRHAHRISNSGISAVLKIGGKSAINKCFDTTYDVILIFHSCYNFNFNTILIIMYISGMTLICINILPFKFDTCIARCACLQHL
jgi:hypothetical protein